MKMSSSLAASSVSAIGVTLAIAFILLVSNFTIINVQQKLTTHPGQLFIIPQTDESTPLSESEEKVRY
jgi:mannose-6-phosphate isomerase class I